MKMCCTTFNFRSLIFAREFTLDQPVGVVRIDKKKKSRKNVENFVLLHIHVFNHKNVLYR